MADFKSGARQGAGAVAMIPIAQGLSEEDFKAAAEYFTSLKIPIWYKVVETATVPKSYLRNGAMRLPVEHGGTEPIGNRIIELPQDDESAESRNPRIGFVAHVPPGSIEKGEAIVTTGADGKTLPPRPQPQGPRRRSAHHRALADVYLPPAQRHQDRHSQWRDGAADEGRS
jgi:hypothetical protein